MKYHHKILIQFLLLCSYNLYGQTVHWANSIRSCNYEELKNICIAPNGGVCVTGSISGNVVTRFGKITIPVNPETTNRYFVASCNSSGEFNWVRTGGGGYFSTGMAVVADDSGNVYTIGSCMGNATFDNISGITGHAFLAKYNSLGQIQWAKGFNVNGYEFTGAVLEYLDGYLYAFASDNLQGDFTVPDTSYAFGIGSVIYHSKIDTEGNFIWTKRIAFSMSGLVLGPTFHTEDGFILSGFCNSYNVDIDNTRIQLSMPNYQSFIANFDTNMHLRWAKRFSSLDFHNSIFGMEADKYGNLYVTGYYRDTLEVEGHRLINSSSEDSKTFLGKFDAEGNLDWIKDINGLGYMENVELKIVRDTVFLLGHLYGYLLVDDLMMESPLNLNITILKFDSEGNACSGTVLGSPEKYIQANRMVADTIGNLYILAQFVDHSLLQNRFLFADSLYAGGIEDWSNTTDGAIFMFEPTSTNTWIKGGSIPDRIQLYPNPNNGDFMVDIPENMDEGVLEIYSIFGKIIYNKRVYKGCEFIHLNGISPGTYILKLRKASHQMSKLMLIQ